VVNVTFNGGRGDIIRISDNKFLKPIYTSCPDLSTFCKGIYFIVIYKYFIFLSNNLVILVFSTVLISTYDVFF